MVVVVVVVLMPSPLGVVGVGVVDTINGEGLCRRICPGAFNLLDPNVGAPLAVGVPDGELTRAGAVDGRCRR